MIKQCNCCGNDFEASNYNSQYCEQCKVKINEENKKASYRRRMTNNPIHVCAECGGEFTGRKTKYCSDECKKEARRTYNRERWREEHSAYSDKEWIDKGIPVNWAYISGYEDIESIIKLKCKDCGYIYEIPIKTAKRFDVLNCPECWVDPRNKYGNIDGFLEANEEKRNTLRQEWLDNWTLDRWTYIGNFTKGNSKIQMQCKDCGEVTIVEIDTVRGRKTFDCSQECNEEVERKKEEQRKLERKIQKQNEWIELPIKECAICGKKFKSWQPTQVTCSKKCSRTHKNKVNKASSKASKYGVKVIDKDITLEGLYERDNGVCHLCGQPCDYDDYKIKDNAFIVGTSYPSIDHLKPRSKGGVHSWKNVKLAHHYCNTIKSNDENIVDTSIKYQETIAL